ncbi:hypothetical protein E2C01_032775 [Portunus trituberculatus]|uniref:Uncharacterized protein n=1 Tax=Portunus trituberculatus TaxID=210409 RepID=A0A5B7F0I6_PORTR|nr:hypothetical protein [Portunus trituberculatus]
MDESLDGHTWPHFGSLWVARASVSCRDSTGSWFFSVGAARCREAHLTRTCLQIISSSVTPGWLASLGLVTPWDSGGASVVGLYEAASEGVMS